MPALIVYMTFLGVILWKGLQVGRTSDDQSLLTAFIIVAVVAYLVKVMFNVSVIPVAPFFFVLLGMVWRRGVKNEIHE